MAMERSTIKVTYQIMQRKLSLVSVACIKGMHGPGIVAWTTYVYYHNRQAEFI